MPAHHRDASHPPPASYPLKWMELIHKWSSEVTTHLKHVGKSYKEYVASNPTLASMDPEETEAFKAKFEAITKRLQALRTSHVLEGILEPDAPRAVVPDQLIQPGVVVRHAMCNARLLGTDVPPSEVVAMFFIPFHDSGLTEAEWVDANGNTEKMSQLLQRHLPVMYENAARAQLDSPSTRIMQSGIHHDLTRFIREKKNMKLRFLPWNDSTKSSRPDVRDGDIALGVALATSTLECVSNQQPSRRNARKVQLGAKTRFDKSNVHTNSRPFCVRATVDTTEIHTEGSSKYTPRHSLTMFSGASHPSKHTLVSYQVHFTGDGSNSDHKAHSSFETFASHEDWREDALCIPKCISSMDSMKSQYKGNFQHFSELAKPVTEWLSNVMFNQEGSEPRHSTDIEKTTELLEELLERGFCAEGEARSAGF